MWICLPIVTASWQMFEGYVQSGAYHALTIFVKLSNHKSSQCFAKCFFCGYDVS